MRLTQTEHLRWWGGQPFQSSSVVEWCGHQIAGIPVPTPDGRLRIVVIDGEAS